MIAHTTRSTLVFSTGNTTVYIPDLIVVHARGCVVRKRREGKGGGGINGWTGSVKRSTPKVLTDKDILKHVSVRTLICIRIAMGEVHVNL